MRRCFAFVIIGVCAACSATPSAVSSRRSDAITTSTASPTTDVDTVPPAETAPPADPEALGLQLETLQRYPDGNVVSFAADAAEDEASVHALIAVPDGWLAAGSITRQPDVGIAALWSVSADGTFGEPLSLQPAGSGLPGVARGLIRTSSGSIVVGTVGAGRDAQAVAWVQPTPDTWTTVILPTEAGAVHGSIADQVLTLTDGTIVVIGRGDGPFFSNVLVWWSVDGGFTWQHHQLQGLRSYSEQLVATDGTRVAFVTHDMPGEDGLSAYSTAVLSWQPEGPDLSAVTSIDPTPGLAYWPRALLWDGTQFVLGSSSNDMPWLGTSPDGLFYSATELSPPGLTNTLPTELHAMLMVDGVLNVYIEQGVEMSAFQQVAGSLVRVDVPYIVAGDMQYLVGRAPMATDGHRIGYLAENWDSKVWLGWDGQAWSMRDAVEIPRHRNLSRLDVRSIVSTGGSDLALLARGVSQEPGVFASGPAGVVWRPAGSSEWQSLDVWSFMYAPGAIAAWNNSFVIADYDSSINVTTWWALDPDTAALQQMSVMQGQVRAVVSGNGRLVARVERAVDSADETATLWSSTDGSAWMPVTTPAEPVAVCSDGTTIGAVWAMPDHDADRIGAMRVDANSSAEAEAYPLVTDDWQLVAEWRDNAQCGVNENGLTSVHVGYDWVQAELSPLSRSIRWQDGPDSGNDLLMPMTDVGSWEAMVRAMAWTGAEWVAVGYGHDTENSMDALIWRSDDGLLWGPAETIAGGPGNQAAWSIDVTDGTILVGGIAGQNATIWTLSL